jgi:ribosome-binding protein aMBF1 (putative translation factor)
MIANARQYRITQAQAERFRRAIEDAKQAAPTKGQTSAQRRLAIAGLKAQLDHLLKELSDYDTTVAGKASDAPLVARLPELGTLLVQARIARGLTQLALAERLGMKMQQVQRYEATRYQSASLTRLVEVAQALQVSVDATVRIIAEPDLSRARRVDR